MPSFMNRSCQRQTQVFDLPVRRMISLVPTPSALERMIAARQACFCEALRSLVIASSRPRTDRVIVMEIPVRMRQTFARSFYDEKLWTSDQDALQLRRGKRVWRTTKPHLSMGLFSDEEAFSTVVYRFLGGGMVQVSEKLTDLDQDRYDLYKAVIPTYAPVAHRFRPWTESKSIAAGSSMSGQSAPAPCPARSHTGAGEPARRSPTPRCAN